MKKKKKKHYIMVTLKSSVHGIKIYSNFYYPRFNSGSVMVKGFRNCFVGLTHPKEPFFCIMDA